MMSLSDITTRLQLSLVLTALTVLLTTDATPSQADSNKRTKLFNNGTAVCPKGWILSALSSHDPTQPHKKLCVRVQEQILSWERARNECRRSKGFLVKLDTPLLLGITGLTEYLNNRGLDSVWTGMHHEHGTLLWDELHPHMVKAYSGPAQKYGLSKRGWTFDYNTFKLGTDTCGKLQIREDSSSQLSGGQAAGNRTKRAAPTLRDVTGVQRAGVGGVGGQLNRGDNEEVLPSRSPNEEKRVESSLTNQGHQENLGESVGDTSNAGDLTPRGKAEASSRIKQTSSRSRLSTQITTEKMSTTTDQSNLEDSDDYPLLTKRSLTHPNTTSAPSGGNMTTTSNLSTEKTAQSTLLALNSTSSTTMSSPTSTSVEDLLNHLMETSLENAAVGDIGGSVDSESRAGLLEATSILGSGTAEQSKISEALAQIAKFKESHSNSTISDDDPQSPLVSTTFSQLSNHTTTQSSMPGLQYNTSTISVDDIAATQHSIITTTSVIQNGPQNPNSPLDTNTDHDNISNSSSESPMPVVYHEFAMVTGTPSINDSVEGTTLNSVPDSDDSHTGDSKNPGELTRTLAIPKLKAGRFRPLKTNTFTGKSTTSTYSPTATEDSQLKDSQNSEDEPQDINTPKSVTNHLPSLIRKIVSKRSTTNIPTITTTGMPTSTVADFKTQTASVNASLGTLSANGFTSSIGTTTNLPQTNIQSPAVTSPAVTSPAVTTNASSSISSKDTHVNGSSSPRTNTSTSVPPATLTSGYYPTTTLPHVTVTTSTLPPPNVATSTVTPSTLPPPNVATSTVTPSTLPPPNVATSTATTSTLPPPNVATSTATTSTLPPPNVATSTATTSTLPPPNVATSTATTSTLPPPNVATSTATTSTLLPPNVTTSTATTSTLPPPNVATSTATTSTLLPPNVTTSTAIGTTSPSLSAAQTSLTSTSDSTTINPPISNNTTIVLPIGNNTTISPLISDSTTTSPLISDSTTTSHPISDNTTTSHPISDSTTTSHPVTDSTTINPHNSTINVINSLILATNTPSRGVDDPTLVKPPIDSHASNTTTQPPITTTTSKPDPSSDAADVDPISITNSTENTNNVDADLNKVSNKTGQFSTHIPASPNVVYSSLAVYQPSNISDASSESNTSADIVADKISGGSEEAMSSKVAATDNVDSPAISLEKNKESGQFDPKDSQEDDLDEQGGNSSRTAEDANHGELDEPSGIISLSRCDDEYASVCATEAIEELSLVGHCDRNWYGHRLLERCYKPMEYILKAIEARQSCLHLHASLATVDTGFYGNITAMILSFFVSGSKVWVDASLNLDVPQDGKCAALEDGQIVTVDCNSRLPFICQKDALVYVPYLEDIVDGKSLVTFVQNLTSFHPQTLMCPLRMSAFDDVILWFKDGRPINNQDDSDVISFGHANGHMPNRLDIDLSILERVGEGGPRIPKPAMLQGLYWCEIWIREPFDRVVSDKIFLKFTDVITLYGRIATEPSDYMAAAMFNRMGNVTGLPAVMERRLATMNKNITHFMRSVLPIVRDIVTYIKSTNPVTGTSEFTTYICVATGDLNSGLRGNMADLYLSTFFDALGNNEDELRQEWNLTLPVRQAVSVAMADMCPETNLFDKKTGMSATFPTTVVNNRAPSRTTCYGAYIGSAFCKGDLQSGAYWDSWSVVNPCFSTGPRLPQEHEGGSKNNNNTSEINNSGGNPGGDIKSGDGLDKPPKQGLIELTKVHVDADNIADVTNRLGGVLDQTGDLSAKDIENVAQVVSRIVAVNDPPYQISDRLVKTANKVLDAQELELRKAEKNSGAPSR